MKKIRSHPYRYLLAITVLSGLFLLWWHSSESGLGPRKAANPSSPRAYGPAEDVVAKQFLSRIFAAIDPALPENAYMPAELKGRLRWMYQRSREGVLELTVAERMINPDGQLVTNVITSSKSLPDGKFQIGILGPELYWEMQRSGGVLSRKARNFYAIAFAHEVIHLEHKGYQGLLSPTREQWIQEELLTWTQSTLELVRPLRESGEPLDSSDTEADDALRRCGDHLPCAELRSLIAAPAYK